MKTQLNPAQFLVLPFIRLDLILKVEEKQITTASRWQQTGTIKRTAKDLKHELAF